MVGAVIVKENQIIGQGYHHKYGDLHAERDALRDCRERGNDPSGATIFVTLEPCCHTGKQPPCVEAIVQAGIKKVVVGSRDPNPLVSGKGAAFLRERGVEVEEDFLRSECDALNFIFFHYITSKTPYVALKYAMTADGKIATVAGKSKWISCQESRDFVHQLRSKHSCIMAGIGTVLADDPLLTCRIPGGRNPTRIICDSSLRLPLDSQLVQSAAEVPTIVACAEPDCLQAQEGAVPNLGLATNTNSKPKNAPHTQILKSDGFKTLLAQTPPKIKRGAVLIDPSYEEAADYETVQKTIIAVHKKWSAGIIMIWYPLLAHRAEEIERMIAAITAAAKAQNANTNILRAEFCVDSPLSHTEMSLKENAAAKTAAAGMSNAPRLYGSGILVINAPWKLDEELDAALKYLSRVPGLASEPTYSVTKI